MFRHGDLPLAMADLIVISNGGFGGCYERESVGWERERERESKRWGGRESETNCDVKNKKWVIDL